MGNSYDASAIEVLSGLEPVRKRPGMYTETDRPNHLAHEVIDNSVDEAIAGFAHRLWVTIHPDGAMTVRDDGRGMPVDRHEEHGITGVELILTRLHAGGKFSGEAYHYSGGLHGVGVSVVNALSDRFEIWVCREGHEHYMSFSHGEKHQELEIVGQVARRQTGTTIRFHPDPSYFDSSKFHVSRLKQVLRAKAVLCPGLEVTFEDETHPDNSEHWQYEDGLLEYLSGALMGAEQVPDPACVHHFRGDGGEIDWAMTWMMDGSECVTESYVNLIPTLQGGTHVSGLRGGVTEAIREFCEFHDLLPRGVKLTPEDVWSHCSYVLSLRMHEPQFSGQTKDRLSSRDAATFIHSVAKDELSLWLNHHVREAERIAQLAIESAQRRLRAGKRVKRKKITTGPALPGKLADCTSDDLEQTELFLVEGDSAGGSAKQARDRVFQAIMPLRGKILNTWEIDPDEVLASQEVNDIAIALGVDPGSEDISGLRYGRICILADADSDGLHIATLLCALFVRHFQKLVEAGRVCVAMPPLYRIDIAKNAYYALNNAERDRILDRLREEKVRGKINVQRFKGLGEMNPLQLRETTMNPETRSLVQLRMDIEDHPFDTMDMLLAKKRAADRKNWLAQNGDRADVG